MTDLAEPAEPAETPPESFVAVAETLRERGELSWRGAAWPRRDLLLLLGFLAVAMVLRLWHVEQWSLSVDEAETWRGATESLGGKDGFFASGRSNYPLVFLAMRWLMDVGVLPFSGEGWLRLPYAFFGILSVPLLALVGDLFVGRRAALFAAALLAVHPWHVQASQTATGAIVATFFTLFAAGAGFVAFRMHNRRFGVITVLLFVVAGCCDPSGWLALLAVVLVVGCARAGTSDAPRWPAIAVAVAAPLLLPVVVVWLRGGESQAVAPWHTAWELLSAFRPSVLLTAIVGLLVWRGSQVTAWLGAGLGAPLGAGLLLACIVPINAELALPGLPAALLLAAAGAERACEWLNEAISGQRGWFALLPGSLFGIVCGLDLAISTYLYTTVEHGLRADWRTARDVVLREVGQRPKIWVVAGRGLGCLSYYLRPNHWRNLAIDPHPGIHLIPLGDAFAGFLDPLREAAGRDLFIVLLRSEAEAIKAVPAERAGLAAFRVVAVLPGAFSAPEDTLYVYRAPPPQVR